MMRRRVVHIACHPDDVPNPLLLHEAKEIGDLELAAERRAGIGVGNRFVRGRAIAHHQADGQIARDHFPGRSGRAQRALQPRELLRAGMHRFGARRGLPVRRVRAAVCPQVDREHLEQRAVGTRAVDRRHGARRETHRRVLEKGLSRVGREHPRVLLCVAIVGVEAHAGIPVVLHFMVVPQPQLRNLPVETPHVVVEQVVRVVAAELVERFGDLRLLICDDVSPHRAIGQADFRRHRRVGVDRVAGMDEKVRAREAHRLVHAQAAPRRVDAPPLADGVGRPGERDIARFARRRQKRSMGGSAEIARVGGDPRIERDKKSAGRVGALSDRRARCNQKRSSSADRARAARSETIRSSTSRRACAPDDRCGSRRWRDRA